MPMLIEMPDTLISDTVRRYRHTHYRHTKIIATLGPATQSEEGLTRLINQGVDVFRLNMAHGTGEWAIEVTSRIRETSEKVGRHVAVMMDVKGPEIRTGDVDEPVELIVGNQLRLQASSNPTPHDPDCPCVSVNYPDLARDVKVGATILIDSGLIRMRILDKDDDGIRCEVLTPGVLTSRRHLNLPGVHVNLPAVTEKDKTDLRAGVQAGIDFVALSFVRTAEDVRTLRAFLDELDSTARIVAKIEDQAGVQNMEEIIREADGVMIARGDLGIEIDYHKLPLVQSQLIVACQSEGKPVIIATHLLESMIQSPMPTRAEVSDVSNAVREQADAVMLSGETTTGAYPFESVEVMKNIIRSIEPTVSRSLNSLITLREPKAKMLRSAALLAQELGQAGIIVFTRSGFLAYVLAALRPRGVPIYAFTDVDDTFNQMLLPWGVEPFLMDFSDDPEVTIANAIQRLRQSDWVTPGSWLVVITNVLAHGKVIDALQLRQVEETITTEQ
ncbi:pyruvate kinase [Novipirellula sp. SH528]|uniref:pyruvate kinase n=1 Tax=Novipirellula sp. SH528 TaxID=3454466 RepID=UPI003F9FC945